MRASRYDALVWARKLHELSHNPFFFKDLPGDLHNKSLHTKAANEGFTQPTGAGQYYKTGTISKYSTSTARQHIVNPEILSMTNANQKLRR